MSAFKPWKIEHIEMSDGIPDLSLPSDYERLYAVFWWHGLPLGHRELMADQLPMPSTQVLNLALQTIAPAVGDRLLDHGFKAPLPIVRARSRRDPPPDLEALMGLEHPLQSLADQMPSGDESVSVIVCTRDRPEALSHCLRSLDALSPPPTEVIVVDNAPTSEATRACVAQFPNIRYVAEPQPGLSVARNTGIRHATGSLLAFTDDDVRVHPSWIAQIRAGFHDPQVMSMTGLVMPGELETEAQVIFEKNLGGFGQGYRRKVFDAQFFEVMKYRGVPVWKIGAGANMAFRREAFEQVGLFNERLGAGAAGCSEDSEFWYRLLAAGWSCSYEPSAVVFHYHRGSVASLKQQSYYYMRGHVAALLVQFQEHRHWGNLHRLGIALPQYYSKLVRQALRRGLKQRYSTLSAEILGCLSGIGFYIRNCLSQSSTLHVR